VPQEEPLNFDISAVEPVGEVSEIAASIERAGVVVASDASSEVGTVDLSPHLDVERGPSSPQTPNQETCSMTGMATDPINGVNTFFVDDDVCTGEELAEVYLTIARNCGATFREIFMAFNVAMHGPEAFAPTSIFNAGYARSSTSWMKIWR
jgi:hypothetical protein